MLQFPFSLMREAAQDRPRLIGAVRSGGRSASGAITMSRSDGGGLWSFGMQSIALIEKDQVRAFEAVAALMAEGTRPIVVPVCDKRHFPAPTVDSALLYSYGDVPHSDGTLHSDGTGYWQPVVDVVTSSLAALRATTLVLVLVQCGELRGGELFSILHAVLGWRMYRIVGVAEQDANSATVTIEPPLREAVAATTMLDFDRPRCVMQLREPAELQLEMRRFGRPSLSFIESFLPLD